MMLTMSGNSHDRRTEKRSLNVMQRVFDALSTDHGLTVAEIAQMTRVAPESVRRAIERLQLQRAMEPTDRIGGQWLYRRKDTATRPLDRRGSRQLLEAAD